MIRHHTPLSHQKMDITHIFESEIKKVEESLAKVDIIYKRDLGHLDHLSDKIAEIGGSWAFITIFFVVLFSWMGINSFILIQKPFDPYPFILLSLVLSCLAAIQAPIILLSQNRSAKRDQIRAELDLEKDIRDLHIDEHSHRMLLGLQKDIERIKRKFDLK